MKLKATRLAARFLLCLISPICGAQDFSADVVYLRTREPDAASAATGTFPHPSSKLFVSKDKLRLETRGLTGTILLVNGGAHTAFALFPGRKAYQPLAAGPSDYFRVENADDACPDWQRASEQEIVCEKAGHEVVGGREAVKYVNKRASSTATSAVWIDLTLKFVVKWEGGSSGAELHNIQEAKQAAELFAVPSDYDILKPRKGTSKGFSPRSR